MGYLNHVMLYLPELGLYDDPTQQFASFGVLAAAEYDKPVIHVSGARAYRAQTPAMKPEEHVSKRRTELAVAADGAVSGTTEQSGTGLFATNARAIAATLQGNGLERSAEDFLRRTGPPGKGRFEIDPLSELGDSYAVRARFTYDGRMTIKPPMLGDITYTTCCERFFPIVTRHVTQDKERLIIAIMVEQCKKPEQ